MTAAPNAIVRTLDDVWTSVGRLFNLPSLQQQQQRQQQVQPEPAPSTTIPLPGGREARLKLLSVAGDYDFGRRSSQYTAMMALGKTMVRNACKTTTLILRRSVSDTASNSRSPPRYAVYGHLLQRALGQAPGCACALLRTRLCERQGLPPLWTPGRNRSS